MGADQELFDDLGGRPLADRLRPQSIDDVVGQNHLLSEAGPIRRMIDAGHLGSLVLWGRPGCGKTTIARLIADAVDLAFEPLSAVFSGVADLRKLFARAQERRYAGQGTLLFVDEIHRFNRAQQDSFLPYVEDGTVTLIGATTENPSFELNAALLSRCQVLVLNRLDTKALEQLVARAQSLVGRQLPLDNEACQSLIAMADGDGRYLLNMCEVLFAREWEEPLSTAELADAVQRRAPIYDKSKDSHYNLVSALHKSLRGSDTDAALYWLARMLEGGEDPRFIARRLLRFAYEDIGLAEPNAAVQALTAWQTYERLGAPEGELALAQAVIFLGTSPKSNAAYSAFKTARKVADETGSVAPGNHIVNASTALMDELGYGMDYQYDHDAEDGFSGQNYFPESVGRMIFYQPMERGFERELNKRLDYWQRLREKKNTAGSGKP